MSDHEQVVTPWTIKGKTKDGQISPIDYNRVIEQFGCQKISDENIKRIEKITKMKVHRLIRRGLVFAHRDIDIILDYAEQDKEFYIYTGRGPSSETMHLGHIVPFEFVSYLQKAFNAKVVVQMTDDEKYIFKDNISIKKSRQYAVDNAKDIIASGLDINKTFIFTNTEYIGSLYPMVLRISKCVNVNQCNNVFGFDKNSLLGMVSFPPVQIAPCFSEVFPHILKPNTPCLIPAAIDQDPYFRFGRDIASKLNLMKPACIYSRFLPSLQGESTKMSSSVPMTSIHLTDNPKQVKEKINKYAFSGGKDTLEEHRKYGGNPDIDVCCQYLRYFLESDDELDKIFQEYRSGSLTSGELKKTTIQTINQFLQNFQETRSKIEPELVKKIMKCPLPDLSNINY